jgi:mRNA-degrading endonuclease YafQ of YafQ-DinJ toxin-antitoxin module
MYELRQTNGFKKDLKRAKKRGLDMTKLDEVVTNLVIDGKINRKFKPLNSKVNMLAIGNAISNPTGF